MTYIDVCQQTLQLLSITNSLHRPGNDLSTFLYLLQELELKEEDVDDGDEGFGDELITISRCLELKVVLEEWGDKREGGGGGGLNI